MGEYPWSVYMSLILYMVLYYQTLEEGEFPVLLLCQDQGAASITIRIKTALAQPAR